MSLLCDSFINPAFQQECCEIRQGVEFSVESYVLVTEFDAVANVLVFCVGDQFVEKVFPTCLEPFAMSGNLCSFFKKKIQGFCMIPKKLLIFATKIVTFQ